MLRDLPLLAEAAQHTSVRVNLSIGTLDEDVWRATEPGTPHPRRRIAAVEQLNAAGVPCGGARGAGPARPVRQHRAARCRGGGAAVQAGARNISSVLLHLRPGVRDVFSRLAESHPHLAAA